MIPKLKTLAQPTNCHSFSARFCKIFVRCMDPCKGQVMGKKSKSKNSLLAGVGPQTTLPRDPSHNMVQLNVNQKHICCTP